jgi:hypothetical protein
MRRIAILATGLLFINNSAGSWVPIYDSAGQREAFVQKLQADRAR